MKALLSSVLLEHTLRKRLLNSFSLFCTIFESTLIKARFDCLAVSNFLFSHRLWYSGNTKHLLSVTVVSNILSSSFSENISYDCHILGSDEIFDTVVETMLVLSY